MYIHGMNVVTIPKKVTGNRELIVVPRKEYEEFLQWKKALRVRVVLPTPAERRAIERGRREIREGKYVEWRQLKHEMARRRR